MLEASQAFDRMKFSKLFRILLNRKMSPLVLRLLVYMYTNQKLQVRRCGTVSNTFTASNGVKQGSIMSPILLSVYMDELFERLEKSGVGCHMGNHYTGSLGYADDLTLLAPTLSGLQVLIRICERYADEFDIKFNGAKSVYMFLGGRRCKCDNRTVMVNGAELHRVNATVHLGDDNDSLVSAAIAVICVTKSRTGNYDFRACARARGFPGSTVFGRTHILRRVCRAITR